MVNFGPEKLLLVGIIALVVLGPHRLPQAARTFGRVVGDLRRALASVHGEVSTALAEPRRAFEEAMGDLHVGDLRASYLPPPPHHRPPGADAPIIGPGAHLGAASGAGPSSPDGRGGVPGGQTGAASGVPDDPALN